MLVYGGNTHNETAISNVSLFYFIVILRRLATTSKKFIFRVLNAIHLTFSHTTLFATAGIDFNNLSRLVSVGICLVMGIWLHRLVLLSVGSFIR